MSMGENHNVTEFIFVGLSQDPAVQKALFVLFTLTYVVTMLGNLLIAVTVIASPSLNSPMYFFLACLSVLDVLYCNTISPNLIIDLFYNIKNISFRGCLFQLFVEHLFSGVEVFLLVFMAYDRYVAICKPLHYLTIMNQQVCIILLLVSGVGGMVHSTIQVLIVYKLPFCGPNVIDHFMCDMNQLLVLACTDTYFLGITNIANGGAICVGIFTLLLVSYGIILNSLKSYSQEGKLKALYTCSSHIMVVVCFFAPCSFINARPVSIFPIDKYITVFYTVVSPMLNPLIYTLRNSEMKNSIKKLWYKTLTT